ncbi:hypothetical protein pb186bvf_011014 [Paramecium bursaria]
MSGSQRLNQYQIAWPQQSTPSTKKSTLEDNLEKLSKMLVIKNSRTQETLHDQVKKVYVNLRPYVKEPVQAIKPQLYLQSHNISKGFTPQTQTPQTPQDIRKEFRKPFIRPQSMAIFDKISKNERSYDTTNQHSQRQTDASKVTIQNKKNYNQWVGLSVIERNKIFLQRKQRKIEQMKEMKEQNELKQCTFTPQFFNHQLKEIRPSSQNVNKSYQEIHKLKKLYNEYY